MVNYKGVVVFCSARQGSHLDWKTWKNGKTFSSQGKVREFWTDWKRQGKVKENHTKYCKNIRELQKNVMLFFSDILKWTVYYLLKCIKFSVLKNKTLKNTGKTEKSGKSQGILSVRKSGSPEWTYPIFKVLNEKSDSEEGECYLM